MAVPADRITPLNERPPNPGGEFVLYWMTANRRASWNFALDRAVVAKLSEEDPPFLAALLRFFQHLEQELDAAGFFRTADKRPGMIRNLRSLFHRTQPSEAEVRTLHGIVTALSGRRLGGRPRHDPRRQ